MSQHRGSLIVHDITTSLDSLRCVNNEVVCLPKAIRLYTYEKQMDPNNQRVDHPLKYCYTFGGIFNGKCKASEVLIQESMIILIILFP